MSKASSADYFYQFCNRRHVSMFKSNLHQHIWSRSSGKNNQIKTHKCEKNYNQKYHILNILNTESENQILNIVKH
ncbi:unnamed protein product [Trifolium pratense]|uniref:Uncharacterized protein n=1 Tax=Trifolium pratense TaxID=57577 RepID=A0ACB0JVH2_TRIPR|nr:unnamed protein product [Trifolium pratense]